MRLSSLCVCVGRELKCKLGEKEIDSINAVEDTKGNNGERGEDTLL